MSKRVFVALLLALLLLEPGRPLASLPYMSSNTTEGAYASQPHGPLWRFQVNAIGTAIAYAIIAYAIGTASQVLDNYSYIYDTKRFAT